MNVYFAYIGFVCWFLLGWEMRENFEIRKRIKEKIKQINGIVSNL